MKIFNKNKANNVEQVQEQTTPTQQPVPTQQSTVEQNVNNNYIQPENPIQQVQQTEQPSKSVRLDGNGQPLRYATPEGTPDWKQINGNEEAGSYLGENAPYYNSEQKTLAQNTQPENKTQSIEPNNATYTNNIVDSEISNGIKESNTNVNLQAGFKPIIDEKSYSAPKRYTAMQDVIDDYQKRILAENENLNSPDRLKRERAAKIVSALGDGLASFANLYGTTEFAPSQTMSYALPQYAKTVNEARGAAQKRIEDLGNKRAALMQMSADKDYAYQKAYEDWRQNNFKYSLDYYLNKEAQAQSARQDDWKKEQEAAELKERARQADLEDKQRKAELRERARQHDNPHFRPNPPVQKSSASIDAGYATHGQPLTIPLMINGKQETFTVGDKDLNNVDFLKPTMLREAQARYDAEKEKIKAKYNAIVAKETFGQYDDIDYYGEKQNAWYKPDEKFFNEYQAEMEELDKRKEADDKGINSMSSYNIQYLRDNANNYPSVQKAIIDAHNIYANDTGNESRIYKSNSSSYNQGQQQEVKQQPVSSKDEVASLVSFQKKNPTIANYINTVSDDKSMSIGQKEDLVRAYMKGQDPNLIESVVRRIKAYKPK